MIPTLTEEERLKFADYLEHDSSVTEGLIEQMKKIQTMEIVIKSKTAEMHAQRIVARMLRRTESWTTK